MRKIAKIVIKRDLCIGAASCLAVAPNTFDLDDLNKAIIVDPHGESDEEILLSARACPTYAIELYDEDGEIIYPTEKDKRKRK
jgi:ferredoxin